VAATMPIKAGPKELQRVGCIGMIRHKKGGRSRLLAGRRFYAADFTPSPGDDPGPDGIASKPDAAPGKEEQGKG
jgi:hypothetical protein